MATYTELEELEETECSGAAEERYAFEAPMASGSSQGSSGSYTSSGNAAIGGTYTAPWNPLPE